MKVLVLLGVVLLCGVLCSASFLVPRKKQQDLLPTIFRERLPASPLDLMKMFDVWNDFSLFPQFSGTMQMDIKETPDRYQMHVDLPGVEKENVKITVSEDQREMQITAFRETSQHEEGQNYRLTERVVGNMSRTVLLPEEADLEKISADFKSGVLVIDVGKKTKIEQECKQREITIK